MMQNTSETKVCSLAQHPINPDISADRKKSPLFLSPVAAGFPSPAEDYIDRHLDLHEHLVKNNAATFFTRASGNFMIGAGINDGDMLIVDRSLDAWHGKIVVAAVEGELTVKYLARKNGRVFIVPANEEYPELDIIEQEDIMVWGVVAYVIHKVDAAALDMK